MNTYIHPFLLGVLSTLGVELLAIFVVVAIASLKRRGGK